MVWHEETEGWCANLSVCDQCICVCHSDSTCFYYICTSAYTCDMIVLVINDMDSFHACMHA